MSDKQLYNSETIAKLFMLSHVQIGNLARKKTLRYESKDNKKGYLFHLPDVIQDYIKYLKRNIDPDEKVLEKDYNRRLQKAKAEKAEVDAMLAKRVALLREDVVRIWVNQIMNCKSKLIALPKKVSYQIVAAEEIKEIEKIIEDEIYSALAEFSIEPFSEDFRGDQGTALQSLETAPKTDSKPVGRPKKNAKQ